MQDTYWMIVANGSCMKLFKFADDNRELEKPLVTLHPESSLKQKDFDTDKHGRTGHGNDSESVPTKKLEEKKFAKEISTYLKRGLENKEYTRLYLAASPTFLGMLRDEMPKEVQGLITEETNRDLTKLPTSEIWSHFPSRK